MKMTPILFSVAFLLSLTVQAQAAYDLSFTVGGPAITTNVLDLSTLTTAPGGSGSDHNYAFSNGTLRLKDAEIVSGDKEGYYKVPDGLTSTDKYVAVYGKKPSWADFNLTKAVTTVGLYFGSIDEFNSIDVFDDKGEKKSLGGKDLFDALVAKGQKPVYGTTGTYLTLTDLDGIKSIIFHSSSNSLEFGRVAFVPLPGAVGLFAVGLVGVAALRRRKMAA